MRKIKLLVIMLFIFLFEINNVDAMTLKPTGDSNGKRGDEITLYITLNRSNEEKFVSAVGGTFLYDSNVLELVSSSNLINGWNNVIEVNNDNVFSYGDITLENLITMNNENIVKVILKIKDNANYGNTTLSINDPSASDDVGDGFSISGGSHTVKVLSDVNSLVDIKVNDTDINFEENTLEYNIDIEDDDEVLIVVAKKDENSMVSGDTGNKELNYGINTFKITVTSESGENRIYTLNINKTDVRNNVNTLESLEISEGKIEFDKEILEYNFSVENKVSSVKIDATLTDELSSFVSGYGPRTIALTEGINSVLLKVKAENEAIKTYTLNITRKNDGTNDGNNYLSKLVLSDGSLDFNKEQLEYNVVVLYEVEKINVTVKTDYEESTYEIINPSMLEVGENEIKIVVTAVNGVSREYKINVIRKAKNEKLSSNSKLSSLNIQGYSLDFESEEYNYYLNIGDEDSLVIDYELDDDNSIVKLEGNKELENGSVVKLTVFAEDGSRSVYTINIMKKESNNNLLLIVGISVFFILIITFIMIFIIKKKKDKTKHVKNKVNDNQTLNNDIEMTSVAPIKEIQNMVYTKNSMNDQNNEQNNDFF